MYDGRPLFFCRSAHNSHKMNSGMNFACILLELIPGLRFFADFVISHCSFKLAQSRKQSQLLEMVSLKSFLAKTPEKTFGKKN